MAFPLHISSNNNKHTKPKHSHTMKQKLDKLDFAERKAKAEVKVSGFLTAMQDTALQQQ